MRKARVLSMAFLGVTTAVVTLGVAWTTLSSSEAAPSEETRTAALSSPGGPSDGLGVHGQVKYVVQDRNGKVKAQGEAHNDIIVNGFNTLRDRLFQNTTTTLTANTDFYDAIYLTSTAKTQTELEAGTIGTKVTTAGTNPKRDTSIDTATAAQAVIDASYTATADSTTISQILLVKGDDGATISAASQIFSFHNVSITLNTGDTVTFTWTVTASQG